MYIKQIYESLELDPTDVLHRFGDNEMMLGVCYTRRKLGRGIS